jgi:D-3-phosphoglycerate dehydrogenase
MKPWRVARFAQIINPIFDERLRAAPGVELRVSPLAKNQEDVDRALAGADVYHVGSARNEMSTLTFVTPAFLERFPTLLCVSTYGAGYDSVDVAACTRAGVLVVNQSGANKISVAEHTMALILTVVHRLGEQDHRMRTEILKSREALMGHEIAGLTLGLVGIGHIGTEVARFARAFGMKVIAADPFLEPEEIQRRGAEPVSLDRVVAESDVLSLHCPRDEATIGMFGADQFARMKPGAAFISTARGGIHDERALADSLRAGHLAGAGLDVWEPEPPALDNPLLKMVNVVATFHTAGVTHEARRNIAVMGSEQILQVLRGEKPPRLVNPDAWNSFRHRFEDRRDSSDTTGIPNKAAG